MTLPPSVCVDPYDRYTKMTQAEDQTFLQRNCIPDKSTLYKRLPVVSTLSQYNWSKLVGDVIAALTVGFMLVPQSLALALLLDVNLQHGLYSSIFGGISYFLLGTAKDINTGPTVLVTVTSGRFNLWRSDGIIAMSMLAFLSGCILLFMGIVRLGFIVKLVSLPVVCGFTSAAALSIFVTQLKTLFGYQSSEKQFFLVLKDFFINVKYSKTGDMTLGLVCLVVLIGLQYMGRLSFVHARLSEDMKVRRLLQKILWFVSISRNVLVVTIVTGIAYGLSSGGKKGPFTLSGKLSSTGMPNFEFPFHNWNLSNSNNVTFSVIDTLSALGSGIIIIPLITFIETISVAKAFGRRNGYKPDPKQELICLGIINILSGLFHGFPVGGSFARTVVNAASGVRTTASGLLVSVIVILSLQFLTEVFKYIPKSVLAAIIMAAVIPMMEVSVLVAIIKVNWIDAVPMVVTFLFSLWELEYGILAGILTSMSFIIYREIRPKTKIVECKEGAYLKLRGSIHYPGTEKLAKCILAFQAKYPDMKEIHVDCNSLHEIDYTVAQELKRVSEDLLKTNDVTLRLARVPEGLTRKLLVRSGLEPALCHTESDDSDWLFLKRRKNKTFQDDTEIETAVRLSVLLP